MPSRGESPSPARTRGPLSAAGLVVASMVGTGVYTTSGYLLEGLSPLTVLIVWAIGGACALMGALAYAELGSRYPHQGGEYALLSRGLHPAAGFVAGAVSVVAGFAAPIAGCAIGFGAYLEAVVPGASHPAVAIALVWIVTAIQLVGAGPGDRAQDVLSALTLALALGLVVAFLPRIDVGRLAGGAVTDELFSTAGGLGVVLVSYAYSGWNAATYVAGEVKDPRRSLPVALLGGTLAVTLLYVALNAVFVGSAPREVLAGEVDIGFVAVRAIAGDGAATVLSCVIAAGLVATTSALVVTGARVGWAMGVDHPRLRMLARTNARGAPVGGLLVQAVLATGMAFIDLGTILTVVGMALSVVTAATVFAALRARRPADALPGSLFAGTNFLVVVLGTLGASAWESPVEAAASLLVIGLSGVGYLVVSRKDK